MKLSVDFTEWTIQKLAVSTGKHLHMTTWMHQMTQSKNKLNKIHGVTVNKVKHLKPQMYPYATVTLTTVSRQNKHTVPYSRIQTIKKEYQNKYGD